MNVYIWNRLDRVTTNWHAEGGIVVVADSLDAARALAAAEIKVENPDVLTSLPDHTYAIAGEAESRVVVFPDAGCC